MLLVFVIYYPVTSNGFVWDDHKAFGQYPYYTDLKYLWRAFAEPLVFSSDYFRPLTSSTFVLQNHLFGTMPSLLHLGSLVLHSVNATLVGLLVRQFLVGWQQPSRSLQWLPLASAALYALHPALVESVAWISARYDLLVTSFMLLTLFLDQRLKQPVLRPAVVGLLFLLAALSKEMALALALGIPFWHLAFAAERSRRPGVIIRGMRGRGDLHVYLAVLIAGLLYLAIRRQALGHLMNTLPGVWDIAHVLLVFRTFYEYGTILLFPFFNISPVHVIELPLRAAVFSNWLPVLLVTLLVVVAFYQVPRHPRSAWLFFLTMASLVPVSNIVPLNRPEGSFFADCYLVYPTAALVLMFSGLFVETYNKEGRQKTLILGVARVVFAIWILASIVVIRSTLPLWNNDLNLWLWASLKEPTSETAHVNLASTYFERHRFHESLRSAEAAIRLAPDDGLAWSAQGRAMAELGLLEQGMQSLEKATLLEPSDPRHWYHLAMLYMKQGDYRKARTIIVREVLSRDPDYLSALINLAAASQQLGEKSDAIIYYNRARILAKDSHALEFIDRNLQKLER